MTAALEVLTAHPGVTVQDHGRPGYLAMGVSAAGAADPLALAEAGALLGGSHGGMAIEMAGMGARFRITGAAVTLALTGAPMPARAGERRLDWHGTHRLEPGELLELGAARGGGYGYLSVAGGLSVPRVLGGCGVHRAAGIGRALAPGDRLALGPEGGAAAPGLTLDPLPRFDGGVLRMLAGPQTGLFPAEQIARAQETVFRRDARANRMGARLDHGGAPFGVATHLGITSEAIVPGDIQVLGDGTPFVLLGECQTTGGYPRLGTVISADLVLVAQAPPGSALRLRLVPLAEALAARTALARSLAALPGRVRPRLRDPHQIADLGAYQLIGGVVSGPDPATWEADAP